MGGPRGPPARHLPIVLVKVAYYASGSARFSVYDICRRQTADGRLQTADCRPQTADRRLQTADCRLQTADCRLHEAARL